MVGVLLGGVVALASPVLIDAIRKDVTVSVVSRGADISRHGGERLIIKDERGSIVQSCNGVCDDLSVQHNSADNVYEVKVLDRAGNCVACSPGRYVTSGLSTRWVVRGDDQLKIEVH